MQDKENTPIDENTESTQSVKETDIKAENAENSAETTDLESKVNELNDKYLRLYSEFDNYRRRTIKEKSDIIKTAAEDVFKAILPIIDDFERAIKANENAEDVNGIKEGVQLIYNKLKNTTQQKGLTAFESIGEIFNPDTMEAITHIPATDETQKGKVVNETEKGYKLGDKVIRYAKVIIAN
ncbi:MAG: nucleotide exchange factor GrpE [Bacteroidetes bacterium]|nr:nucleotide exchange factor GrpE [Bacteroidota bacterium]